MVAMINETPEQHIVDVLNKQKSFLATHQTKSVTHRLEALHKLKKCILSHQQDIEQALWNDLHKSPEEAYLTEISIVLGEIDYHIKHLKKWSKPKHVPTPLQLQPSSSKIIYEPLGVALIIAPWNYPFQLLFNSLVGAISAGCCAILKPSPDAAHTALVMKKIIEEIFDEQYVALVQGGKETNTILLAQRFDMIFFTGSPKLGKVVMEAAAKHLTPVVLELGGKSPCIVDENANIKLAAKRIVWGKFINAGQTCIAPDYMLVHEKVKPILLKEMVTCIKQMYGEYPNQSRFYPRIISAKAFDRLMGLLNEGGIYFGGQTDANERYISPTIIDNINARDAIMQEEIFGPIMPVLTFSKIDEAINYINNNEKPLALYYFGPEKAGEQVLAKTSSGGACINDTLMHIANHHLPFGGVGNSGMGKYHAIESFKVFSNQRAVVSTPTWIDLPFKYIPFKYFNWIKKIL